MDARFALIRAHDDSIRRYQRLLNTQLTDLEREYIESRISEERSSMQSVREAQGEISFLPANGGA
ncbi:hypothetical protein NLM31_29030 [Bradyrhizobium sp. CCGUVB4N]|uniref:hypothetical protein n=1 Tax=Bradyrhizobium sp. CCGUVB4N TaxID=2949631 RepID=UPI0020B38F3A|nr:hypothetical protein [Bradyrhizobium sp. CCGUVB4N]MCP3384421.1 hypothetical protein [Bradyrhizobium sp. CCGUVB4N]